MLKKTFYLLTPSSVKLTMSITPPAGCVSSPRSPFPIPLKNPSTPSERAPSKQKQTQTTFLEQKTAQHFLENGNWDKNLLQPAVSL